MENMENGKMGMMGREEMMGAMQGMMKTMQRCINSMRNNGSSDLRGKISQIVDDSEEVGEKE